MKQLPSKSEVRSEIEEQIEEFLQRGGEVKQVGIGATGLVNGDLSTNSLGFERPRQTRTPVPEVVAAIEQRRQAKLARKPAKKPHRRSPRSKVIYDDFGEPIRKVWIED